ncbi:MAG: dephospho-CoA kinase [Pseudomonadota bacterium]
MKNNNSHRNKPLVVGLTGGIGSGKSEVAALFEALGALVIDADQLAYALLMPEQPNYTAVIQKLGNTILDEQQRINRRKLRQLIFKDAELKKWLEELLHPRIRERMKQLIQQCDAPYCILVIPLLIENLPNPLVDRILVVDVDPMIQKQRVEQRDQLDSQQIDRIINAQASREQRVAHADDVIDNSGNLAQLRQQVEQLHHHYYDRLDQQHLEIR